MPIKEALMLALLLLLAGNSKRSKMGEQELPFRWRVFLRLPFLGDIVLNDFLVGVVF